MLSTPRIICTVVAMTALLTSIEASARTCNVTFDDRAGFAFIYKQARDTFAVPTGWYNGVRDICPRPVPTTDTGSCSVYRQRCGDNYFTFFPNNYNHYHLTFDDPTINCIDTRSGGLGRQRGSVCEAAAWYEPRSVVSHLRDAYIELAYKNGRDSTPYTFRLYTINVGSQPIQLWFKKPDGSVWGWSHLGPNTNWAVNTGPTTTVWISGAPSASSRFTILGFSASD